MADKTTRSKPVRILAFDTSLSFPGAAVVEIKSGKATVKAVSSVKTGDGTYAVKTKTIESWAHLFVKAYMKGGYDYVVREAFTSKMPTTQYAVFSAWAAVDRALADFDLTVTEKPIAQSSVKKAVVGKGKAEKAEVEAAVRELTGYDGKFANDNESDAVAVALAYAIQHGLLTKNTKEDE